jgi:hypothetical protein
MFDSGCLEGKGGIPEIRIPNMSRQVFEAMMMFVYTGDAGRGAGADDPSHSMEILPDLLRAADMYLLEKLKVMCADLIAKQLTPQSMLVQFELARQFNCTKLEHNAIAYAVLKHEEVTAELEGANVGLARIFRQIRAPMEEYIRCYLSAPVALGEPKSVDQVVPMEAD